MSAKQPLSVFVAAVVFACGSDAPAQAPLGTTFSYQGQLKANGVAVNGLADFEFTLWDAEESGSQFGVAQTVFGVPVADGLFTVKLNAAGEFGTDFYGMKSWLHTAVRSPAGSGDFVPFTERQEVTPAPSALFASNGTGDSAWETNPSGIHYLDGRVGIGTISPKQRLHVNGDYYGRGGVYLHAYEGDGANGTAYVQARDDSGTSSIGMELRTQSAGTLVNALKLTPAGNVGIGTADPGGRLHVRRGPSGGSPGTSWQERYDFVFENDAGSVVNIVAPDTTDSAVAFSDTQRARGLIRYKHSNDAMSFRTAGVEDRMYIDSGGNVGIGTTTPGQKLTVAGMVHSTAGGFRFPDGTVQATAATGSGGGIGGGGTANYIPKFTNGTTIGNSAIYDDGGNVGIGTAAAERTLQIGDKNIPNSEGMIRLESRSGTQGYHRIWDIGVPETDADTSGTGYSFIIDDTLFGTDPEFMIKFGSGRVGIGTTEPAGKLHVSGGSSGTAGSWFGNNDFIFENDDHSVVNIVSPADKNSELIFSDTVRIMGAIKYQHATDSMNFRTAGQDGRMVIDSDGDIGIGTSGPQAKLHVSGRGSFRGQHIAYFESTGSTAADGIAIQLSNAHTNRDNNFITFYNGAGTVTGRIEGFDYENGDWVVPPPLPNINLTIDPGIAYNPDWLDPGSLPTVNFNRGQLPSATLDPGRLPSATFDPGSVTFVPPSWDPPSLTFSRGELPSLTFSDGSLPSLSFQPGALPSVEKPPITFGEPSLSFDLPTQAEIDDLICWTLETGITDFYTTDVAGAMSWHLKEQALQLCKDEGVTYGSKGADYAEWLPKLDPTERFQFGQIVGVHGGKVSLKTEGAEQIMAVSRAPVVVGNVPPDDEQRNYVTVGFMGQLPVVVRGEVKPGDYIVPSGMEDGTAVAVAPENLRLEHLGRTLGRAWSESDNDVYSLIDVVIGFQGNEAQVILRRQQAQIEEQAHQQAELTAENAALRSELQSLRADLARITDTVRYLVAASDSGLEE